MEDNNFNKTELFENCYCQKVLPLAYDNSLSYYEVICKLVGKINELIDIINETGSTISEETEQRSEADTQLQNNINTEKTARENADAQLQTNIDNLSNDVFHKNQVVPIANGGTGASDNSTAFSNLTKNTTPTVYKNAMNTDIVISGIAGAQCNERIIFIECYKDYIFSDTAENNSAFLTVTNPKISGYNIPMTLYNSKLAYSIIGNVFTLYVHNINSNREIKKEDITGLYYMM